MDIIIDKKTSTRLNDGIDMLLSLDDETFDTVVNNLADAKKQEYIYFYYTDDQCENPRGIIQIGLEKERDEEGNRISRYYFSREKFSLNDIFKALDERLTTVPSDSKDFERIKRLINTRTLEKFKDFFAVKEEPKVSVDTVMDIVSKEDVLERFLDYDNNVDFFSHNGEPTDIKEYLICLGKIFGSINKDGKLSNDETIDRNFYIPEIEKLKDNYMKVYEKYNFDRYINPEYELRDFTGKHASYRFQEEKTEWEVSEELKNEILGNMPDDLTLEEKAMYIYYKMCYILTYDDGYFYRDKSKDEVYENSLIKEHLESIKPGSKITCFDFSRIYTKIVNSLGENIKAATISEGLLNEGHFLTGFYTDNVSVMLEAINVKAGGTNDLMKARNSIKPEGMDIISDKQGLIDKAIDKVVPLVTGEKAKTIEEYTNELRQLKAQDVPNDLKLRIESFIEILKQKGIYGNEAIQDFLAFYHVKFFGEFLHRAYIGRKEEQDGKVRYKRMLLLRSRKKYQETPAESELYLIDSETLDLAVCTEEEIINRFKSEEFVYESDSHKMEGIDLEDR